MIYDSFAHLRDKRPSIRGNERDNSNRPINSVRNLKRRINAYVAPVTEEPVEETEENETETAETAEGGVQLRDLGYINGELRLFIDPSVKVVGEAMVGTFQEAHAQVLNGEVSQ